LKHRELGIATFSLLVLWQIFAMILHQPILPSPMTVAVVFWEELGNGLLINFAASLWRVVAGIGLSLLLAVPAGLVVGQSQKWNRIFSPFLYLIYPIPKVVFVPIVFLLFGIGDLAKIPLIFLILFFQVLVLVRDAAVGISPQLLLSLRSLGAGRRALFRFVYLPASIPAILTGLRQSIGTAVAILYITELFANRYGLGYYIYYQGSTLLNYPAMYAGVVAMSLLGLGLYFGVDWLQKRLVRG